MEERNEIMAQVRKDDAVMAIEGLTGEVTTSFYSGKAETADEKLNLYDAVQNSKHKMKEIINTPFTVKDVYAEVVTLADGTKAPRVVLISPDGDSVTCVSKSVLGSLQKLFAIFGQPPYEEGIAVIPRQVSTKNGQAYTLEIVRK